MSRTAYLIVAVELDDDDNVTSMAIDHESAPWAFSTKEDNVWDEEREEWLAGYRLESEASDSYNAAEAALNKAILAYAGTKDAPTEPEVYGPSEDDTTVVTIAIYERFDTITVSALNVHTEAIFSMNFRPRPIPEALDAFRRNTTLDTAGVAIVVNGEDWEEGS